MGFDAAADSMKSGSSCLLLLACDLSERTLRSITYIAEREHTEAIKLGITMEQLGNAVGKRQTGILSVNDRGFADKLKTLCTD